MKTDRSSKETSTPEPNNPNPDEEARALWTRRSALALTAGFLSASASSASAAGFAHKIAPRADHIVVSKKNRVMELRSGDTVLKRYRIHLGFTPQGHKFKSGDGRTPEGRYYINRRNARSRYHLSLGINYPNAQDMARAQQAGVNPGGDIFIHGQARLKSEMGKRDWTAGCIAVTDHEIEEIWSLVPTGIPVTIFG